MMKHYVMPIHTKNGATVCTPDGFAMKQRIERLKRELRINHLKTNYGIDESVYRKMYKAQHGVCAICKQPESIEGRQLCVDHSHITGDVRGTSVLKLQQRNRSA